MELAACWDCMELGNGMVQMMKRMSWLQPDVLWIGLYEHEQLTVVHFHRGTKPMLSFDGQLGCGSVSQTWLRQSHERRNGWGMNPFSQPIWGRGMLPSWNHAHRDAEVYSWKEGVHKIETRTLSDKAGSPTHLEGKSWGRLARPMINNRSSRWFLLQNKGYKKNKMWLPSQDKIRLAWTIWSTVCNHCWKQWNLK